MEPITIDAETVRLRPHREDDLDALVEAARDPEAVRWTSVPAGFSRADAEEALRRRQARWAEDPPSAYPFAVADPADDRYLGNLDLRLLDPGRADVGYWLHPAARGRGVMAAAVRALAGWALAPARVGGLGLEVLQWQAHVGNWASRRVAWAAGFRIEGRVRGLVEQRGERHDGWIGTLRPGDPLRPTGRWLEVPLLKGARCVLRDVREEDAGRMADGRNDPLTQHFLATTDPPLTAERSAVRIVAQREQYAVGAGLNWAIAESAGGELLGAVSLMEINPLVGTAEIGYWLHPEGRGRGLMTEAVRLAVGHAFRPAERGGLGLRRLSVEAAASNGASLRVAERAGFTRVGVRRRAERLGDGSWDDLVVHDLLADEAAAAGAVAA